MWMKEGRKIEDFSGMTDAMANVQTCMVKSMFCARRDFGGISIKTSAVRKLEFVHNVGVRWDCLAKLARGLRFFLSGGCHINSHGWESCS
jgi:hypothetical protein